MAIMRSFSRLRKSQTSTYGKLADYRAPPTPCIATIRAAFVGCIRHLSNAQDSKFRRSRCARSFFANLGLAAVAALLSINVLAQSPTEVVTRINQLTRSLNVNVNFTFNGHSREIIGVGDEWHLLRTLIEIN